MWIAHDQKNSLELNEVQGIQIVPTYLDFQTRIRVALGWRAYLVRSNLVKSNPYLFFFFFNFFLSIKQLHVDKLNRQ